MREIWKPIPDMNGYECSSFGRLRSYWRSGHSRIFETPREMKLCIGSHGYLVANIRGKVYCVHRLVCETFHGLQPKGHEVAHNDGVRTNNAAENLRWVTRAENIQDCYSHGTLGRGEAARNVKLTLEDVRKIRALRERFGWGARRIGRTLNIPSMRVGNVLTGGAWKGVE